MINAPSKTMQAVCAVRLANQDMVGSDPIIKKIFANLEDAEDYRKKLDQYSNNMFTRSILIRSKFFLDVLEKYKSKAEQLIIVGGGLDFRFTQIDGWQNKSIYFIDHPVSLELTKEVLHDAGYTFENVIFVPCDLQADLDKLAVDLDALDFDSSKKTLFILEGVSYYLYPSVIKRLIKIAFADLNIDYLAMDIANKSAFMSNNNLTKLPIETEEVFTMLRNDGEPWYGFMLAEDIVSELKALGCESIDYKWDSEIEQLYMQENLLKNKSFCYFSVQKNSDTHNFGQELYDELMKTRMENNTKIRLPEKNSVFPDFIIKHWLNFAVYYEKAAVHFIGGWMSTVKEDDALHYFAHQIEDECNHYKWLKNFLKDYTENVDSFVPPKEWKFLMEDYYPSLDTLVERLAAHNIAAETGALGFMTYGYEHFPPYMKKVLDQVIKDETYHVLFGKKLLSKYCNTPELRELARKSAYESLNYMEKAREVFVEI